MRNHLQRLLSTAHAGGQPIPKDEMAAVEARVEQQANLQSPPPPGFVWCATYLGMDKGMPACALWRISLN